MNKIQNSFFLISSENLEEIKTELYGYIIEDSNIIIDSNDIIVDKLDGTGAYCYILRNDSKISIYQDFCGCYGLYFYQNKENDFFAISNSFLKLVEYLKEKFPLTFNYDYAKSFIPETLVPSAYEKTLINEIIVLNKDYVVNIDITEKTVDFMNIDYKEKSVKLESKEALVILDKWFNKWVSIINKVYSKTNNINLQISGGFDTRILLTLALSSQMNLDDINMHAHRAFDLTKSEDLEISTKIAEELEFKLNKGLNAKKIPFDDIYHSLDLSLYSNLGFSKVMYWKNYYYDTNIFTLTGLGGALLKGFYNFSSFESFMKFKVNSSKKLSSNLSDSVKLVLEDTFKELYRDFGGYVSFKELSNIYYAHVRNRYWCGKIISEAILYNEIKLNPLMDPLINQLDINVDEKYALHTLIFLRYCPKLLEFEFQGGRKIPLETLKFAKKINNIYPFELDNLNKEIIKMEKNELEMPHEDYGLPHQEYMKKLYQLYDSFYFKKIFSMYFTEELYNKIRKNSKNIIAAVYIVKIIEYTRYTQIKFNNTNNKWFESCLNESNNVLNHDEYNLSKYFVGRLDINNYGVEDNNVIIDSISDNGAIILKPSWNATKKGHGTQIESSKGCLDIAFTCVNDGKLRIALRSKNIHDKNKKRLPIYIDFKNFVVDSEEVFKNHSLISHDEPYFYFKQVKDNQKVKVHIEWEPFNENSYFKE